MRHTFGSALWGKRDGGTRPRALVAAVIAVVALAIPAVARAGEIPTPLLNRAKENPAATFNVIVQTKTDTASPTDVTVSGITKDQRKALDNAVKAANDATKKAAQLAKKAADAQKKADAAQKKADAAAAKAAQTGKPNDQAAAVRAQADADKALAAAQDAQAAADAAQASITLAQIAIAQAQAELLMATSQARQEINRELEVVPAVGATLTGAHILALQDNGDVIALSPDEPVQASESNSQRWVDSVGARWFWGSPQRREAAVFTPTIAVVDSGIDASRIADFGGRVLAQVDLTSGGGTNSSGDGRGHGTMVASIAAGGAEHHTGVDPDARLVSLDVMDDNGRGRTSNVIAAIDWILRNRFAYNIRVANFSLQAGVESSFRFDPLSRAVERLWLNGVTVVAAAGNYAAGGAASGVLYAPASDPFVIAVGAVDTMGTGSVKDDVAAPWSAWGYTRDGFLKPELSAPGRYMIGASPSDSTLSRRGGQDRRLVEEGYLQLSGTSFAAPVVSGAAAALLGLHPEWTPDQVKGALMVSANDLPAATFGSAGVGEVDLHEASEVGTPPNPNAALDAFLVATSIGPVFDAGRWSNAAKTSTSWNTASWSSASWSSASWSSASWSSASWNTASWSSASWSSASWSSASWTSAIDGNSLAFLDNASTDSDGEG